MTTPIDPQRESPPDPRVVALRALFPDYDDTILQSVLESVEWSQDRAVDTLLIMSDPDYKPEPPLPQRPQRHHTVPALTQEQLDEQFARQLVIQDQQQGSQWAASRNQPSPALYPAQPQSGPPGQGTADFQDQFNKFAESSKKSFGSFLNKVKTKFQEFEQGRPSGPSTTQWTPGPASYYGPPPPPPPPNQGFQYVGQSPSPSPPAPLPASDLFSSSSSAVNHDKTPETEPEPSPVPQPLMTSAPPIDGGKLGLLPKRPVSLITDDADPGPEKNAPAESSGLTAAPVQGYSIDDDDDDGLEYAENPFEEPAHKK